MKPLIWMTIFVFGINYLYQVNPNAAIVLGSIIGLYAINDALN